MVSKSARYSRSIEGFRYGVLETVLGKVMQYVNALLKYYCLSHCYYIYAYDI